MYIASGDLLLWLDLQAGLPALLLLLLPWDLRVGVPFETAAAPAAAAEEEEVKETAPRLIDVDVAAASTPPLPLLLLAAAWLPRLAASCSRHSCPCESNGGCQ